MKVMANWIARRHVERHHFLDQQQLTHAKVVALVLFQNFTTAICMQRSKRQQRVTLIFESLPNNN